MTLLNKRRVGAEYEEIAADYMLRHGYKILERNYHNRYGELDIIAEKDNVLIYTEIKFRRGKEYGGPLEAVDIRKQRRISRAAAYHYAGHGALSDKPCRFDVIGIYGDGSIRHIENAFFYQGRHYS